MILFNFSNEDFQIKKGDRIAQLICERIYYPDLKEETVSVYMSFIDDFPPNNLYYRSCPILFVAKAVLVRPVSTRVFCIVSK